MLTLSSGTKNRSRRVPGSGARILTVTYGAPQHLEVSTARRRGRSRRPCRDTTRRARARPGRSSRGRIRRNSRCASRATSARDRSVLLNSQAIDSDVSTRSIRTPRFDVPGDLLGGREERVGERDDAHRDGQSQDDSWGGRSRRARRCRAGSGEARRGPECCRACRRRSRIRRTAVSRAAATRTRAARGGGARVAVAHLREVRLDQRQELRIQKLRERRPVREHRCIIQSDGDELVRGGGDSLWIGRGARRVRGARAPRAPDARHAGRVRDRRALSLHPLPWASSPSPGPPRAGPARSSPQPAGSSWPGILIFSGSLYVLSVSGIRWLGAITPIGGLCMIAGWALLAVVALRTS